VMSSYLCIFSFSIFPTKTMNKKHQFCRVPHYFLPLFRSPDVQKRLQQARNGAQPRRLFREESSLSLPASFCVCALLALTQAGFLVCAMERTNGHVNEKPSVSSELHLSRSSRNEVIMPTIFFMFFPPVLFGGYPPGIMEIFFFPMLSFKFELSSELHTSLHILPSLRNLNKPQ
jgi:hypothetical protein